MLQTFPLPRGLLACRSSCGGGGCGSGSCRMMLLLLLLLMVVLLCYHMVLLNSRMVVVVSGSGCSGVVRLRRSHRGVPIVVVGCCYRVPIRTGSREEACMVVQAS